METLINRNMLLSTRGCLRVIRFFPFHFVSNMRVKYSERALRIHLWAGNICPWTRNLTSLYWPCSNNLWHKYGQRNTWGELSFCIYRAEMLWDRTGLNCQEKQNKYCICMRFPLSLTCAGSSRSPRAAWHGHWRTCSPWVCVARCHSDSHTCTSRRRTCWLHTWHLAAERERREEKLTTWQISSRIQGNMLAV